mmetsp:Transcript_59051/g.117316  ORF Transcript_59051/g.117316 Transcript_59051/m.117316 type:complete len:322 (-) Transcript_59051:2388-3353(-)
MAVRLLTVLVMSPRWLLPGRTVRTPYATAGLAHRRAMSSSRAARPALASCAGSCRASSGLLLFERRLDSCCELFELAHERGLLLLGGLFHRSDLGKQRLLLADLRLQLRVLLLLEARRPCLRHRRGRAGASCGATPDLRQRWRRRWRRRWCRRWRPAPCAERRCRSTARRRVWPLDGRACATARRGPARSGGGRCGVFCEAHDPSTARRRGRGGSSRAWPIGCAAATTGALRVWSVAGAGGLQPSASASATALAEVVPCPVYMDARVAQHMIVRIERCNSFGAAAELDDGCVLLGLELYVDNLPELLEVATQLNNVQRLFA